MKLKSFSSETNQPGEETHKSKRGISKKSGRIDAKGTKQKSETERLVDFNSYISIEIFESTDDDDADYESSDFKRFCY